MTAIVCILMGCGVPTTATYIIMVTIAAPALGSSWAWCRSWRTSSSSITACWPTSHRRWRWRPTRPPAWPAPTRSAPATPPSAWALAKALVPFVFVFSSVAPDHGDQGLHLDGVLAGFRRLPRQHHLPGAALSAYLLAPMAIWERLWLAGRGPAGDGDWRARHWPLALCSRSRYSSPNWCDIGDGHMRLQGKVLASSRRRGRGSARRPPAPSPGRARRSGRPTSTPKSF